MNKIVICHFYNEEYLLHYWLAHHRRLFDHGILIDYASTDNSCAVIKEMTPTWEIIPSRNKNFDAMMCDSEVLDIERTIKHPNWRVALNVTEFIIGNFDLLNNTQNEIAYFIGCHVMVDEHLREPDPNKLLIEQNTFGIPSWECFNTRRARSIHNYPRSDYPIGRHFSSVSTNELSILWYSYSPWNAAMLNRKTQIHTRIPETDRVRGMGYEHFFNLDTINNLYQDYKSKAKDLRSLVKGFK